MNLFLSPVSRVASLFALSVLDCVAASASAAQAKPPRIAPYLALNGKEVKPRGVKLDVRADRIVVEFTAPRAGKYSFGLSLADGTLSPLVPNRRPLTGATLNKPLLLRYPYDWTWRGKGNVLNARPRLVMPGVESGGKVYLIDTRELCAIRIEPTRDGLVRALLLKHRFYNDGGDAATAILNLRPGKRQRLDVLIFDSLAEANRERFGPMRPMHGRMMSVQFRGWPTRALSKSQYEEIAETLRGVFDFAIVREVVPHDCIPPVFHSRDIHVLHYQYLGGLRRGSAQLPKKVERAFGLKDAQRHSYTAPRSPNGSWLLCDIRTPKARSLFVENAARALRAGFDGVFLDGPGFRADALGRRGGSVPQATQSLARARWQLLNEIAGAMRPVNPKAILGILGNQYYDTLGVADFVLKERMYFAWDRFGREFEDRRTVVSEDMDVDYETGQAPYAAKNVVYGVKGYNPIAVQSSLHFIRRPRGLFYFGVGDFLPDRLSAWASILREIATEDDLYITSIRPSATKIHFEGRATFWSDAECRITFSRTACVVESNSSKRMDGVRQMRLSPRRRFRLLRECK